MPWGVSWRLRVGRWRIVQREQRQAAGHRAGLGIAAHQRLAGHLSGLCLEQCTRHHFDDSEARHSGLRSLHRPARDGLSDPVWPLRAPNHRRCAFDRVLTVGGELDGSSWRGADGVGLAMGMLAPAAGLPRPLRPTWASMA